MVTGKILNTTREIHKAENRMNKDKIVSKDIKKMKKAMNLETMKSKLKDEDLYEHVSEKDNSVNERSFIFIHGSKFKIPHLNSRVQAKTGFKGPNYYRTFVSNIPTAQVAKYADARQRYNAVPHIENAYKDTLPDVHNVPVYYPPNDILYYPNSLSNNIESEVTLLNNKVKAANGAIGEQYRDMKLKNDLVNMHSNYPGLLNVDEKKKYPKDNQIKFKKTSKTDKIILKDVGINVDSQNELKRLYAQPLRIYDPPIDMYHRNYPSMQHENIRQYVDYINVSNQKPEYVEVTNKDYLIVTRPVIPNTGKNVDDHREYIELLKPPILRNKVDLNSMFNKVNPEVVENQHAYPHYQNFKDYNIHIPYRMKNDLQLQQKSMQDELSDNNLIRTYSPSKNIDYYRENSGEEPEFHDARLISKIEEMKKIDAALQEQNIPKEPESPREHTIEKYGNSPQHVDKKVKSHPSFNKSSCVYPGCEFESREHHNKYHKTKLFKEKCKCAKDKLKNKSTPLSSNIEPVTEMADASKHSNQIIDVEDIIP